jgi:hypothetical protein
MNLGITYTNGNFTFGASLGNTAFSNTGAINTKTMTGESGYETRIGYGASYQSDNFYFGWGKTHFRGIHPQHTGFFKIGHPKYNLTFDNDVDKFLGLIPLGDGGDRFRSAGVQLQFDEVEMGLLMYTGDPGKEKLDRKTERYPGTDKGAYVAKRTNPDSHRMGALYFGIGGYRLGYNSEDVRHHWQNKLIHKHVTKSAFFKVLPIQGSVYGGHYSKNPYTTW